MRSTFLSMILSASVAILVVAGCAKVSSPSGGPRDVSPPAVLKISPPDGTTHFSSPSVTVTFDEYFVLEKIDEKFMVSPPTEEKPSIRTKGKELIIGLKGNLKDSTTYTFYFQDAIRDNNERNPIPNFQYVMSTGTYVDSLSVTGNLNLASNLEPASGYLVGLYSNLSDTAVMTVMPDYITRSDPSGNFRINNVKPGIFNLAAFEDLNGDKKLTWPEESVGYFSSPVEITPVKNWLPIVPDTVPVKPLPPGPQKVEEKPGEFKLYTFKPPVTRQYLKTTERKSEGGLFFSFNIPLDSTEFTIRTAGGNPPEAISYRSMGNDTLLFWLTDSALYNRQELEFIVTYPYTDTTNTLIQRSDTIIMRYIPGRQPTDKDKPARLGLIPGFQGRDLKPNQKISYFSSTPVKISNAEGLKIWEVADTILTEITSSFSADSIDPRKLEIKAQLKESKKYQLIVAPGTIRDIYGLENDTVKLTFGVKTEEDYGRLRITLDNSPGNVIVQLLDQQEKVIREIRKEGNGTVDFRLVERGKYRVRAVHDINGDGKWTTGDFKMRIQPEPVTYFTDEIEIKINWEIEEEWNLYDFYQKKPEMKSLKK